MIYTIPKMNDIFIDEAMDYINEYCNEISYTYIYEEDSTDSEKPKEGIIKRAVEFLKRIFRVIGDAFNKLGNMIMQLITRSRTLNVSSDALKRLDTKGIKCNVEYVPYDKFKELKNCADIIEKNIRVMNSNLTDETFEKANKEISEVSNKITGYQDKDYITIYTGSWTNTPSLFSRENYRIMREVSKKSKVISNHCQKMIDKLDKISGASVAVQQGGNATTIAINSLVYDMSKNLVKHFLELTMNTGKLLVSASRVYISTNEVAMSKIEKAVKGN